MVSEPVTSMASTPPSTPPLPALTLPNLNQVHHFLTLKPSPTNYLLWKTQFLPLLRSFDLMGLIDGTDVKPPATLPSIAGQSAGFPNPDYASWTRRDQLLLSWIIASLSEEVLPQVVGINSSYEVWNALHQASALHHTRASSNSLCNYNILKRETPISPPTFAKPNTSPMSSPLLVNQFHRPTSMQLFSTTIALTMQL